MFVQKYKLFFVYIHITKNARKSPENLIVNAALLLYIIGMIYDYIYYNPNPTGAGSKGDCVIRAICAVSGQSWHDIYDDLCSEGRRLGDWGNSDAVWGAYLRRLGFARRSLPNTCPDCYTVGDFAADHFRGSYILGTGSHAVAVINGTIYDTADSSDAVPIFYFERR